MITNRLDLRVGISIKKKSVRYSYFIGCKVKCNTSHRKINTLDEIGIVAEFCDDKKCVGVIWPNNIVCVKKKKNLFICIENKEDEKAHKTHKAQVKEINNRSLYVKNKKVRIIEKERIIEEEPGEAPINIDAKNYEVRLLKK